MECSQRAKWRLVTRLLTLVANSSERSGTAIFLFAGVPILPKLWPGARRREFATSVTVGSTPTTKEI